MRPNLFLAIGLVCLIPAIARGGTPSPFPDRAARAQMQSDELSRVAAWIDAMADRAPARLALQDRYDVTYYRLALDLRDLDGEWLYGDLIAEVTITDGPLDSLLLDFHETYQIDSLVVDGVPTSFDLTGEDLTILPSTPLEAGSSAQVRVYYQGHPWEPGGSFGLDLHQGTPILWTLSEPLGARYWWPCKDDPGDKADSLDVLLRTQDWMIPTSNGLLVEQIDHGDGSHTFHWQHRYPIATFLVSLAATNYVRLEDWYVPARSDSMVLEHFVYPEHVAAAEEDFSITPDVLALFADLFGVYPFLEEKYGHSIFPWGGGMEHQTNTSYGSMLIRGDHLYDWLLVHEAAHMWWGDMTTPADWRDVWLKEGFCSYAEALWYESIYGFAGLHDYMVYYQPVTDPSGPLYDPDDWFDGNTVYNKGAWVCHMLRYVLGDETYYAAMDEFRARTEYGCTSTIEFIDVVEGVSGQDLDWFFQPWVYGINRPHFQLSYLPFDDDGTPGIAIHVDQTQTAWGFFSMPVEFEVNVAGGGSVRDRFWHDPDHLDFEFTLPSEAVDASVDPDDWILSTRTTTSYTMHITKTGLVDGTEGHPFEDGLIGRGGIPPYLWSIVGSLPDGIELDPVTGVLSGVAPAAGEYEFTIRLRDAGIGIDEQLYRWQVLPDPAGVEEDLRSSASLMLRATPVPATNRISFAIEGPATEPLSLAVYDLMGRTVRTVMSQTTDRDGIEWDGRDDAGRLVAAGVYLVRVWGGTESATSRVVWLR